MNELDRHVDLLFNPIKRSPLLAISAVGEHAPAIKASAKFALRILIP